MAKNARIIIIIKLFVNSPATTLDLSHEAEKPLSKFIRRYAYGILDCTGWDWPRTLDVAAL